MSVQTLAAQLAVERIDERLVCRLTSAGEVQYDTKLVCLQVHFTRDKLATIVYPDRLGIGYLPTGAIQCGDHFLTTVVEPGIVER